MIREGGIEIDGRTLKSRKVSSLCCRGLLTTFLSVYSSLLCTEEKRKKEKMLGSIFSPIPRDMENKRTFKTNFEIMLSIEEQDTAQRLCGGRQRKAYERTKLTDLRH